ncbi:succinyl-:3-ketoacid-coenzyme A transferase mitochondrial precursor [Fusarium sp. NRRL 52700]|nr:succinyl-:3-ketoacid-coenzyme A transferase mitochondrial precursor [Fusarium sp. NRRL 52700]
MQTKVLLTRHFSTCAGRYGMNEVVSSTAEALKDMKPNTTVLCDGFDLCGVPDTLINEVLNKPDFTGLTAVSNNAGTYGFGLGKLLKSRQMSLTGDIELELTPQGTLAERCASGGKGIPAFYTPAGVETVVQNGNLPSRNKSIGSSDNARFSDPKDVKVFDGKPYLLERTKGIEKYTWGEQDVTILGQGEVATKRERIVQRAAKEFKNGMYAQ